MDKERERLEEIARGNIERHLSDIAADYESEEAAADAIYDEAFSLGYDALVNAGVPERLASEVASYVARNYAEP